MNSTSLAIIIPVYKSKYLSEALLSIANQSNKDFTIYIGNDNSPDLDIEKIVSEYKPYIQIVYKKFENNLGLKSLVKQWDRCISMSKNEEWLWLFSDDDLMDSNCVEEFKQIVTHEPKREIYRFNSVKFIVQQGNIYVLRKNNLPGFINVKDFFFFKTNYKVETYAIDFIFSRSLYKTNRGFPDFPLGWCSDDAFWLLSAKICGGIKTIQGPKVFWRFNDLNISGKEDNVKTAQQKLKSCILFSRFLKHKKINKFVGKEYYKYIFEWFNNQYEYRKHLFSGYRKIAFWITFYSINPICFYKKGKYIKTRQPSSFPKKLN